MKLPKLYRKVYLKFEWIIDSLQGGEHCQDWGFNYIPAMRVLDAKGNWFWSVIDWCEFKDEHKKYFDKYNHHEEDGWSDFDYNRLDDDGQIISYYYPYNRLTIKEQKQQRSPAKRDANNKTWMDFDPNIPF